MAVVPTARSDKSTPTGNAADALVVSIDGTAKVEQDALGVSDEGKKLRTSNGTA